MSSGNWPQALHGACLCGAVQYEVRSPEALGGIVLCHCRECRKAGGGAYAAVAPVAAADFRLLAGGDSLAGYESSPGKRREFCRRCGSPILSRRRADPASVRLRIATLDGDFEARPTCHNWVSDKAVWERIADTLPQNPRFEPERPPNAR